MFAKIASVSIAVLILAAGVFLNPQTGSAKPEYTRRSKLTCEYCHPPNSRDLFPSGEYYRTHHYKMDGFQPDKKEQLRLDQLKQDLQKQEQSKTK